MFETNLVTGFWNIRIDRSESKYLENFRNVLSLQHNLTIFVPKVYEKFVLENRKNILKKTDIVILELEDIKNKYFTNYWDNLQKIRIDPQWYNSTNWLKGTPQYFSEWYNPIVMSKVFFLYEAYVKNKFNSNNYIWIDAGITQHIPKEVVCDESIKNMAKEIKKILFSSVDYIGSEVHGFHYDGYKKYTTLIPDWLCRATIFGCNSDYLEKFKNDYSYYLEDTLKRGYLGTEESIFSLLSCIDSEMYIRYHTTGASMPNIFLQNMKNYK